MEDLNVTTRPSRAPCAFQRLRMVSTDTGPMPLVLWFSQTHLFVNKVCYL